MKNQCQLKLPALILSVAIVLTLVTGCKTSVETEFKPEANFSAYSKFTMLPLPQTGPAHDPGLMLRLAQPAQDATVEALTAKGFQQVDRAQADFVVNLCGQSIPKIEVTDWGYNRTMYTRRYGHIPVHVGEVDVRTYEDKTLTIEVFDNKSHELVWTGSMTKESSGKITPEKLKEAITAILAKFPPTANQSK